jgi:ABC-2 type transport system permease protein
MSRYLGNIVDLLVTPITPPQFVLAYTLASMIRGVLVGIAVWLISTFFAQLPWAHPPTALLFAALSSFLFAQFGMIAAIYSNTFDALSMYSNFVILPLVYLGGVFYPVSILPPLWESLSRLNPLFYPIDGFRHAILGTGDVPLVTALGVTAGMAVALFLWTSLLIGTGHKLRS